ncbi:MAG: alpha/beta fold hydrolase [Bacteroidota bacterium]
MELNYKSFGQGPPLVILHGLFGMLDNWQTIAKQLAAQHSVFIVDQRNHGRSPHTEDFNYRLLAEDLRGFLESQWIYRSHILGHSMGGKTAMQFALDYPEMVEKLVVVDIGPERNHSSHTDIFGALLDFPITTVQSRKEAEAFLAERLPDYGVRQFLLKNLSRQKTGGYRWKMNLPVLHREYQAILAAVELETPYEGPALFVRGARSNYLDPERFDEVRHFFPGAQIQSIPEAGHWVHADQPDQLLAAVQNFLREA